MPWHNVAACFLGGEAGCPYCVTIDGETAKDQAVTIRDRDTGAQERVALDRVAAVLVERLGGSP